MAAKWPPFFCPHPSIGSHKMIPKGQVDRRIKKLASQKYLLSSFKFN